MHTEAECKVTERAQQKTDCHDGTGTVAVYHKTVYESRQTIDERTDTDDDTEACVRYTILGRQAGHRYRKVLTHKIIDSIAYHRHNDSAQLPLLEFLDDFRRPVAVDTLFCHYVF